MSFIRILTDVKSRNKTEFDLKFIQVIIWSLMGLIRPECDYNLIFSHIDAAKSKNEILKMKIWRTEKDFDVRIFANAQAHYGLRSDQVWSNSLE